MKSESFLILHRQQGSYHVQDPETYQEHWQNSPCDISGSTVFFMKLREYILCTKNLNNDVIQQLFSSASPLVQIKARACIVLLSKMLLGWQEGEEYIQHTTLVLLAPVQATKMLPFDLLEYN